MGRCFPGSCRKMFTSISTLPALLPLTCRQAKTLILGVCSLCPKLLFQNFCDNGIFPAAAKWGWHRKIRIGISRGEIAFSHATGNRQLHYPAVSQNYYNQSIHQRESCDAQNGRAWEPLQQFVICLLLSICGLGWKAWALSR